MSPKLYILCDIGLLDRYNFSILQFLELLKPLNDIALLQYRDKFNDIQIQKQNLVLLKNNTNIPIIINDKIELLDVVDGLHLGQEDLISLAKKMKIDTDLVFKLLKKKYPNKIFGLSTHNELEILQANTLPLDYIGLGAYRQTNTKKVSNILGDKISYLAKISHHLVGAIGGVKKDDKIDNIAYNVVGSDLFC